MNQKNNLNFSHKTNQNQTSDCRWPVFIFKKSIQKRKNKQGKYFYIISFTQDGIKKEVFVPHSWLREDINGKGYYGYIQLNYQMSGQEMIRTKINSNDWIKYFPPKKMLPTK